MFQTKCSVCVQCLNSWNLVASANICARITQTHLSAYSNILQFLKVLWQQILTFVRSCCCINKRFYAWYIDTKLTNCTNSTMITKLCFLSFCLFLYVFIPTIDILGFFYFVFIQVLYLFHPKCKAFLGNGGI